MKRALVTLAAVLVVTGATAATAQSPDLGRLADRIEQVRDDLRDLCIVTYGAEHPGDPQDPRVSPAYAACIGLFDN